MKCGNCKKNHPGIDDIIACYHKNGTQLKLNTEVKNVEVTPEQQAEFDDVSGSAAEHDGGWTPLLPRERSAMYWTDKMVEEGTFTIVFSPEDHLTIRFHTPDKGHFQGIQLISYLYGPNNLLDYRRFGNWTGKGYRIWKAFKEESRLVRAVEFMIGASREEVIQSGEVYALASSRCWRCRAVLTRKDSITRGMGATCAGIILGSS